MKIFMPLIFLSFLLSNCSHDLIKSAKNMEGLNLAVSSEFGDVFFFLFNSDSSFVICTNKKPVNNNSFRFFIYNIEQDKSIYRDVITNGSIKWISQYEAEIINQPGTVRVNNETPANSKYIFNVLKEEKSAGEKESVHD